MVDNGSTDDSVEKIKKWAIENLVKGYVFSEYSKAIALKGGEEAKEEALENPLKPSLVLIRNKENMGFTGGNNVAIYYALHKKYPVDYVFLLNNDAKVEKDCLANLVSVAQKTEAGIVGAIVADEPNGRIQFAGRVSFLSEFFLSAASRSLSISEKEDEFWPSFCARGTAMLIRKSLLDAVFTHRGFYLNPYLFAYADEVDFCSVSYKLGYKCIVAARAVVYHKEGGSAGGSYNPIACYYHTRNRILLARNLLPLYWKILFHIVNLPLCIGRILKHRLSRRPNVCRAMICGLVDGYKGVTGKWEQHDSAVYSVKRHVLWPK